MTDNGLKRMILLSYGQSNEGPTDAAAIVSHYTDCSSLEVTISTLTLWIAATKS